MFIIIDKDYCITKSKELPGEIRLLSKNGETRVIDIQRLKLWKPLAGREVGVWSDIPDHSEASI